MASRMLFKINLPLRFLRNTRSVLTRSVVPIAQTEAPQHLLSNSTPSGMIQNLFARQMATSRASSKPSGSPKVGDEEDEDDFEYVIEDNEFSDDEFDVGGVHFHHIEDEDEEEEEEEEVPPPKKSSGKKI